MITFKQVETFRAVMRGRSMTGAARVLFVTQSAVSKIIQEFERELGLKLFSRRKGGLSPTSAATRLHSEVERIFLGLDQVARTAERLRLGQQGQLRIAAMSTLTCGFLQSVIVAFREQHPRVGISVETYNSHEVVDLVASGMVDFGFAGSPIDVNGLVVDPLWKVRCVCILPPHHPLGSKATIVPADLRGLPFVSLGAGNTTRFAVDSLFRSENISRTSELEASWSIAVSSMVARGLGVSVIDPFTAEVARQSGCLVRPFSPQIIYSFALIRAASIMENLLAEEFAQAVASHITALCATSPFLAGS